MLQISHLIGMDGKVFREIAGLAKRKEKSEKSSRCLHVCTFLCKVSCVIQVISKSRLFWWAKLSYLCLSWLRARHVQTGVNCITAQQLLSSRCYLVR